MKQTNKRSINPLSFPLLPCLSRAEKWNRKVWPLKVVSYEFQILAFNYCQLSNTVISLICFVFTVTGRGILYSFFVNFIAFARKLGLMKQNNLLWLLSCFLLWAFLSACVNPGAELPGCSTVFVYHSAGSN